VERVIGLRLVLRRHAGEELALRWAPRGVEGVLDVGRTSSQVSLLLGRLQVVVVFWKSIIDRSAPQVAFPSCPRSERAQPNVSSTPVVLHPGDLFDDLRARPRFALRRTSRVERAVLFRVVVHDVDRGMTVPLLASGRSAFAGS